MLRFLKVTLENLNIGKLSITLLATWNFMSSDKMWLKVCLWWNLTQNQVDLKKNVLKGFIRKKREGCKNVPMQNKIKTRKSWVKQRIDDHFDMLIFFEVNGCARALG